MTNTAPPPVRVRKTHKNDAVTAALQALPFGDRLEKNADIEARNEARCTTHFNHVSDPANFPDDASDVESNITIEEEELSTLRNPGVFALYTKYPKAVITWLAQQDAKDKKKREAPKSAEESREAKRRCKDGSDLKPRILGTQQQVSFNQILYDTDDARIHIPLPFFTNKSLRHIDVKASVLPVQKANPPDNEKKAYNVLKIDELTPILGEELSMDYGLHAEAMGNFYRFQKSRDPLGSKGSHAAWYESHIYFFDRQPDKIEFWESLKHLELELRLERLSSPTAFDLDYYVRRYDEAKNNAVMQASLKERIREEVAAAEARVRAEFKFKEDRRPPRNNFTGRPNLNRPFPSGSGRTGSAPSCIACEGPHPVSKHYDGSVTTRPRWAQVRGNDLYTPDGRRICIPFNLRSPRPCTHSSTDRAHVCTLCGRSDHEALSGVCKTPA